jgi:transcriptional regulator with XRE-family HTH domain
MPVKTVIDPATPGGRIRMMRESKELTQSALGERVHVTQSAVAQWETNRWLPSRQCQFLLAEALGTSRHFLFGEAAA